MRKILTSLLCFLLVISIVGCSNPENEDNKKIMRL